MPQKSPTYPNTRHIKGSKGVVEDDQVPFEELDHVVVEEKFDGSEVSLFFRPSQDGSSSLQVWHRNALVDGGAEYGQLQSWAYENFLPLKEILSDRYVLFGEWLYFKHTIFYDSLPSYLMVYDVWDSKRDVWLFTPARKNPLEGLDVCHVPVLYEGSPGEVELDSLIGQSQYRTDSWRSSLQEVCQEYGRDYNKVLEEETDNSPLSEGLYIKEESSSQTVGWYKYVREVFWRLSCRHRHIGKIVSHSLNRHVDRD